ncbi:hypothetical protein PFISCL1PPCAC_11226 [Pristionchus fissidentatus]|uniref:BTB domain-containing protein n=1 Tax=Pristionchus fissidentatus TaxID=1538716 RepID=A0AAV5VQ75_9BILA|nr:hypothetical protein PFISCL1PPCAC_11226 [Pristionchus fissidentatus]
MDSNVFEVAGARLRLSGEELDEFAHVDHRHYMKETFEAFNEMRRDGSLCDIVIVAEDKKLSAHKVLLSARIPYFRAMFCSDMLESRAPEVYIYEFDYDTTEQLLEYAYTGCLRLSTLNVQAIMIGANFLRIDKVLEECGSFLVKRLKIDNAVAIFTFCRSICYAGIESTVLRFIEKHFVLVAQTADFLELCIDDVVFILQRDSLYVDGEEQVFDAVMRWIGFEENEARRQHAARLLSCVRLPRLQPSFLSDFVAHHDLLKDDIKCRDLVDEAKDYLLMPERRSLLKSFRTMARVCDEAPALIFAMGGLASSARLTQSLVEVYDAVTDTWSPSKPMTSVRSRIGIAVHDRKVFAIGGFDGKDRLDLCEAFDTESNEWSTMPPLHRKRSAMATAVLDGTIYVCGGYDGVSSLACVETFDTRRRSPEWRPAAAMNKPRSASGSCVLDGVVYVIGGHDGMAIFTGGERFCPEKRVWEEIAPMTTKRCRLGVAALNGKIYAAGGYDGTSFMSTVECYDPAKNEWTPVSNMNIRRCRSSLAVSHGKLFVIGGFDGLNNLSSCEVYDPSRDEWELRSSLKEHAGGVSVGTVPIPATVLTPTPAILMRRDRYAISK